ncbi:MAG: DoxX family protein [Flavobacteriaceae bacterium]
MKKNILLALRIIVAVILIQTLRFKFTAHPDSVYIFKSVGLEPLGRIAIGIIELIAGVLLLIPKTVWAGSLLGFGIMSGAIMMHLTKIGIIVNNDNGILFATAIVTFILSAILLYNYRKDFPIIGNKF